MDTLLSLESVPSGSTVVISHVEATSVTLLSKLLSMGLVAGSEVTVLQRGIFGSPINVRIFGSVLSLRADEAALIKVSEYPAESRLPQVA